MRSSHTAARRARHRIWLGLLAVALLAAPARAEAPFGAASVDLGSADTPWSVHAADLDADGDLDVLSASQTDDEVNWYENDGGSPPAFTPHTLGTELDGPSTVFSADLDADGDLDVVATGILAGELGWYENDGSSPPLFSAHLIDTGLAAARGLFAADLDGDGDVDVLAGSEAADEVVWYENDGASPPGFTRRLVTTLADAPTSVSAADLDRDGDLDVLSTSEADDTLAWYENDGASPPGFTRRLIFTDGQAALWHAVADLDGDGDPDVALASTLDNMISWFENDGASPPGWTGRVISLNAIGARGVLAADLDGDGDVDVASASESNDAVTWYENDGASPPDFVEHEVFASALGASAIASGDVDGDGDRDLISASFDDDHIRWYPNQSIHHGLALGPRTVVSSGVVKVAALAAGDLDRDGAPDLVSAALGSDEVSWHRSDGASPPAFASAVLASGVTGASAVAVSDLDADGAPDVVAAAGLGSDILWLDGDGATPAGFVQRSVSSSAPTVADLAVADLDRDGDADLVAPSLGSEAITGFRSDGASPPGFASSVLAYGVAGAGDVQVADLDGDGDADLVSAHRFFDTVAWHEGDGSGTSVFATHLIDAGAPGAAAVEVVDLDRDGDLDVVAASPGNDTVAWYESDGAPAPGFTRRVVAADASGVEAVKAADLDRDGDLDLVAALGASGVVAVYESDGASPPAFAPALELPAAAGVRTLALVDLDRDGRLDLAAGSASDDSVAWYPNHSGQLGFSAAASGPAWLLEGSEVEVLAIDASHLGRAGDGEAEVAALALHFEGSAGAPLGDAEFNALVDTVRVYADDGSGALEIGTDPVVALFGGFKQLADGALVLALADGSPDAAVALGAPRRFFVSLEIVPGSSSEPVHSLRVRHAPASGSAAEDRTHDTPLRWTDLGSPATPLLQVVASLPACADGVDNDGDGLVDHPQDPGCKDAGFGSIEAPQCDDGADNDLDAWTDHPDDPQCEAPWWDDESMGRKTRPHCGLGPELALLLPLLGWLRGRRR